MEENDLKISGKECILSIGEGVYNRAQDFRKTSFHFCCHMSIKSTNSLFPTREVLTTCCQNNASNSFKWDLKVVVPM